MIGESVGCSKQPRFLGRGPLRGCGSRVAADNVVLIDVESETCENVVIVDVPESLPTKFGGGSERLKRGKKVATSWKSVIFLDEDDEDTDDDFDSSGVKSLGNFHNDVSSSRKSNPSSADLGSSSAAERGGYHFVQANVSPVKLSKGKRTYSGKAPARSCFGLVDTDGLSYNDSLDCELMEDSHGRVKELWEKAYSKRKLDLHNGQPAQGSSYKDTNHAHRNINVAEDCRQCEETPSVGKQDEGESAAPSTHRKKSNLDYTSDDLLNATLDGGEDSLLDSILKNHFSYGNNDNHYRQGSSFVFTGCYVGEFFDPSSTNPRSDIKQGPKGPSSFPCQEKGTKQVKDVSKPIHKDAKAPLGETCLSRPESCSQENVRVNKGNLSENEPPTSPCKQSVNSGLGCGRSSSADQFGSFPEKMYSPWPRDPRYDDNGSETKLASRPVSSSNAMSSQMDATSVFRQYDNEDGGVPGEAFFDKESVSNEEMRNLKDFHQVNVEQINERSWIFRDGSNEVNSVNNQVNLLPKIQQHYERDVSMHGQHGEAILNSEVLLMGDREKLKVTDEYKKAIEEEWASRQQALQIQAEEAQNLRRLRKRMKAETLRLLDMEKRQKQRVEEIRETQKKDEENSNLKEIIRAEVRKDLNKLEVTCHDMASLLRGLGIPVGVGLLPPLLSEVRSAYKRALLAFHPDRASRSDIRQQVEAEEKFKLISRMREKFLGS